MTQSELESARVEVVEAFARALMKYPHEHTREIMILCLGTIFGTSYATDVERYGSKTAREFAAAVFQLSTLCAKITGADPDFRFAIIEKDK